MSFKKSKEILFFLLIIFSGITPVKSNEFFSIRQSSSQGTYLLETFNLDTGLFTSLSSRTLFGYKSPDASKSFYDAINNKFYLFTSYSNAAQYEIYDISSDVWTSSEVDPYYVYQQLESKTVGDQISNNASNITSNDTDIATNQTNISTNTTNISTLRSLVGTSDTTVDINGGAIDGTVIGANSSSTGFFTTIDTSSNGTIGGTLGVSGASTLSGNLDVNGDTSVTSFDSSGVTQLATGGGSTTVGGTLGVTGVSTLTGALTANGGTTTTDLTATGTSSLSSVDINGGTIDGTAIGENGGASTGIFTTLSTTVSTTLTNVDINDGDIDGTAIGANSASSGAFTTLSATGNSSVGGTLGVTGASTFTGSLTANGGITTTGISATGQIQATGLSSLSTVDINGGAIDGTAIGENSKSTGAFTTLSATGNSTVGGTLAVIGALTANGGATIDNIQIGITENNEIDTSTGNLTIDSEGGTTTIDDNAVISGSLTVNGTNVISSITTNQTNIATNSNNISSNDTDIATNATNISSNDTDIASNATNIGSNDTDIATNASNISSNDTDIASNATNISSNDTDIANLQSTISTKTNGGIHIGSNSLVLKEEDGRQKMWATDSSGKSIPIDITNGSKLLISGRDVEQSIDNVGALSAALTGLPTVPTDSPVACGLGTGTHGGNYAFSGGCASRVNEKLAFNAAASFVPGQEYQGVGNAFSARAGFVFKLGKVDKKTNKTEEISSLESRIKTLNQIKNKNSEQIKELTALLNKQTKLLSKLQIKNKLISRLEKLEKFALNHFESANKSLAKK